MPRRPWYKWFPADYAADTRFLSLEEHGAYRMLLDHLWIYGPVPDDPAIVKQVWGKNARSSARLLAKLRPFFEKKSGKLDHWKIREQREQALEYSEVQRQRVQKRWHTGGNTRTHKPDPDPEKIPKKTPSSRGQKKGSRLPDDWTLPDEWRRWARAHLSENGIEDQAARFKDYWIAKPGKDGGKLNWQATWRNWVRRAAEDGGSPANGAQGHAQPVWKLTDAELMKLAQAKGIPTKGKTRQELIGALR